jgi:DNA polymerase III delta prime subunit
MTNIKNELWCEKYRPKTIDDCILPEQLKITLKQIISSGSLPNMMFCGGAGVGKTTVARALANEMEMDCLFLNASENGNIDTLNHNALYFAFKFGLCNVVFDVRNCFLTPDNIVFYLYNDSSHFTDVFAVK